MKNTFSRATAHLRLNVSTITVQLRSIYGIPILIFAFLTLGVGQAWGNVTHVVGMASSNSNNYTVKVNCKSTGGDGCGEYWSCEELTKAGITFEGKKLYVGSYTSCFGWIYNMQFQYYNGGSQVSSHEQYGGSAVEKYYDNYIYNYDAATKAFYGAKTVETGARFYFDATGWSETSIKLVVGHANYQRYSTLTRITNTNLYYGNSGNKWTDAMGIGVVGNTSASDGPNWLTNVSSKAKEYTGFKNYGLTSTGTNNVYLCVNKGKAGEEPTMSYFASHYANDALNYTLTMKYAVSTNGATPTELTSDYIPADITVSTYKFVSGTYNSVSSSSLASAMTKGGSTYSSTVTAARTAATTFTVSNVHDDYAFVGWYTAASGGTELSTSTTYTTYSPTASATIYARFNHEKNHTVTVSYTCASPSATVSTATTPKIGEVTYSSQTAPTVKGYTFVNWTLGTGLSKHSSDALTSNPIRVITNNSGSGYTLTANYTEDLSSTYKLRGSWTNGWITTGEITMAKKSGHSTEDWVYCTKSFTTSETTSIKVYNSTGGAYYGAHDASNELKKTAGSLVVSGWTLEDPGNNVYFRHDISGTYEFGYNTETHEFKVTWPDVNQLYVSAASPTDATNTNAFDLSAPSSNVRSKTLTLNANTTYTFKIVYGSDWYGKNSGTLTRSNSTSSNTLTGLSTSGGNMTLTTDYAGSYTFKFNQSTKTLSVDFPTAYRVTWDVGDLKGNSRTVTCVKYGTSTAVVSNSTWIKSGDKVTFYAGGNNAADVVNAGYGWKGYYGSSDGSGAQLSEQTGYSPTVTSNIAVYACFYELNLTITLDNVGNGHVYEGGESVTATTAHVETESNELTATPLPGWKFYNWTIPANVTAKSGYTATSNPLIINASAAATLTANYQPRWAVGGSNLPAGDAWSGDQYQINDTYYESPASSGQYEGQKTIDLAANTQYELKIKDRKDGDWYGFASGTSSAGVNIDYNESGDANSLTKAASNMNVYLNSAAQGTYTFKWNEDTKNLTIDYPISWWITTGQSDALGGSFTAVDNSSNDVKGGKFVADGATVTFTADKNTGYRFDGWFYNADYDNSHKYVDNNTDINLSGDDNKVLELSSIGAVKAAYAKFTAKTYTVTLTQTGAKTEGSTSATATYNAVLPSITLPTPNDGYAFMGYYSAADGEGRQFINPSGEWVANAGDTISDSKWIRDGDVTLYAYYKKAEITEITFSPGTVVENNSTVTVTATISPAPTGTTSVCWRVLYDTDSPLDSQPEFDPVTAKGNSVSFTAPNASGMYKVEAKLHTGSSCGGGTLLSTRVESFQVAGSHTVTIAYKQGSTSIKASASITAQPLEWSEAINAPDIFGYTFDHWTAGDGITLSTDGSTPVGSDESSANPIYIKANYNGTLTANYTQKNIVYFKDNLGWTDPDDADAHIYVNLLQSDYWDDGRGSGNYNRPNRNLTMNRVPGTTDIFYYDYGSKPTSHFISFTKENMENSGDFYQIAPNAAHVVFPSRAMDALTTNNDAGLGFYAATPMFVPLATQTPVEKNSGRALYYNDGYWTKYLPGTGYTLQIYNESGNSLLKTIAFTSADELMPMKAVADLEGGHTYKFQLKRDGDVYYGNGGTMTYTDHGQNTAWDFYNNSPFKMCTIKTNAAGDYTFNLSYSPNSSGTIKNRLRIAVDYPVASGDYRLVYTDNTRSGRIKPSAIVPKENDGTAIVSFFVRKDQSPVLRIQQATVALDGTITWKEYPTDGTPTNQITGSIASAITATGVWNFNLEMNGSGAMSVASTEAYKGNYYIRTDAANSKWDNYRTDPNHVLTSSDYLKSDVGYTHYYTHWVNKDDVGRKNVKFCIANDYSPCISDTLARETATGTWENIATWMEEGGDLKRSANVRFMWDEETNNIARAYIDGAQGVGSDNFLKMLSSDDMIKNADGSALSGGAVYFTDNQNWIYEANIKAQPNAQIKLISNWGTGGNTITQYFKGTVDATEALIGGSGSTWYNIRLLYDFKTNRLVAAYIPSGEITNATAINADVMFIREHQGDIAQLTFSGAGTITNIKTAYGVLRFNKWTLNNKEKTGSHTPLDPELSIYERSLYWISFPFRVKLSEVFGFGTYMNHWAIQRYDGAGRAAIGHFLENGSFWRWMDRSTEYLEPNQGYLLSIDVDLLGESSDVWGPESLSEQIELYFPSYGEMPNLTSADVEQTLPAHSCTINRAATEGLPDTGNPATSYNRTVFDSHWNVMSVPTYVNTDDVTFANTTWTSPNPRFLYTWNSADNTISATTASGFNYQAMHSYMVQYYDKVTWSASSGSLYSIVARKTYADKPREIELRLELQQNEQMIDRTYVVLSNDEDVSANFAFGEDMCKEFNAHKASIFNYTADHVGVAGNTMPMSNQTTIIPMGLNIETTGDYTFSIPEGTDGVGVVLVDEATGIRTSLSALDYTVTLQAGDYTGRFVLEISPIQNTPTGLEEPTSDSSLKGRAQKVMIDGILYIVKDGKMFDARGARVE